MVVGYCGTSALQDNIRTETETGDPIHGRQAGRCCNHLHHHHMALRLYLAVHTILAHEVPWTR